MCFRPSPRPARCATSSKRRRYRPPAAGAVKVWATELSPFSGELLPTIAEARPPCAVDEVVVLPTVVQPVRPFSKPPLAIPLAGGAVTLRLTAVLCVALAAVPVIV